MSKHTCKKPNVWVYSISSLYMNPHATSPHSMLLGPIMQIRLSLIPLVHLSNWEMMWTKVTDKAFLSTWSASSLVGVIIRARKKPFGAILSASSPFCSNILAVFSCSSKRRCKMGNPKASVFPEPVSAAPITSWQINKL